MNRHALLALAGLALICAAIACGVHQTLTSLNDVTGWIGDTTPTATP